MVGGFVVQTCLVAGKGACEITAHRDHGVEKIERFSIELVLDLWDLNSNRDEFTTTNNNIAGV